ncbi:MAG: hypothetical protein ACK5KR_06285 [Breznakia sp.]
MEQKKNELQKIYKQLMEAYQDSEVGAQVQESARLHLEQILQLLGKNATKVVISSMKDEKKMHLSKDIAALLYSVFMLMAEKDISLDQINHIIKQKQKDR